MVMEVRQDYTITELRFSNRYIIIRPPEYA
jgi:hypothetical protein